MKKYSMTCSCGDVMTVDAASREEAVEKLKGMMTDEAIKQHMADKHPGVPVMTVEQCHAQIDQDTREVTE